MHTYELVVFVPKLTRVNPVDRRASFTIQLIVLSVDKTSDKTSEGLILIVSRSLVPSATSWTKYYRVSVISRL